MIRRQLAPVLVVAFLFLSVSAALAAPLSRADLRRFGYIGYYRGDAQGSVSVRDDDTFGTRLVNQAAWERLPVRNRTVVTGPSRRNGFYLTLRSINGNDRRVKISLYYSGISFNPDYDEDMVGSGSKTLTITRRGLSSPRFDMTFIDKLNERAVDGGKFYGYWTVRGFLSK